MEEARLNRWTSVGYVKVLGLEDTVLPALRTCVFVRVSRRNMPFCGTWPEKQVQGLEERLQEQEFFAPSVKRSAFCVAPLKNRMK